MHIYWCTHVASHRHKGTELITQCTSVYNCCAHGMVHTQVTYEHIHGTCMQCTRDGEHTQHNRTVHAGSTCVHTTHMCLCTRMEASVAPPNGHFGVDNRGLWGGGGAGGLCAGGHSLQLQVGQTLALTGRHLGTQLEYRVPPWGSQM